ncbi:MAG: hypothetical protein C4K47_04125 [Candidatus Thorarchaeota archaeon]|nr:MAG: hypothetical protein C4K47_04125 [Candidatus Thorarchaeota archaeon]
MPGNDEEPVLPVVRITAHISKPVPEVWNTFLDPVRMVQWLGNEITSDTKKGGFITFRGKNAPTNSEIEDTWTITEFSQNKAILCSWSIMGVETLFVLRFSELAKGTLIEVKHGAIPLSASRLYLPEHWNVLLANFKSVTELGEPAVRFDYSDYRPLRITRYDPKEVRQSVLIRAPPSLPFDVWTNPEKLRHFVRAPKPKVDPQYAGIYTWWAEGRGPVLFRKLVPDKEIEFSWVYEDESETIVNVRFDPAEDYTVVNLHHHDFRQPEDIVGYDIGWTSVLSELKLVCELGESGIMRYSDWK